MIAIIIVCILALLLFLRFGVLISFHEDVKVKLKIGFIKTKALQKDNVGNALKKKEKEEKPKENQEEKEEKKKTKPKITFEIVRSAVPALFESLQKGLKKTGKRVKINPLKVSVVFGGSDHPARAAEMYGWTSAAVFTYMPYLEKHLNIPDPSIHVDVNYTKDKADIQVESGISICLFDIILILLAFAHPFLKWFRKHKKELYPEDAINENIEK